MGVMTVWLEIAIVVGLTLLNLGDLHRAEGRYGEAETECTRALAILERRLGPAHPDVAAALNNLALVHRDRGEYAAAESLLRRAVAIYDGPSSERRRDHPRHAQALENLAKVYRAQGKTAEADDAQARAAIIWLRR